MTGDGCLSSPVPPPLVRLVAAWRVCQMRPAQPRIHKAQQTRRGIQVAITLAGQSHEQDAAGSACSPPLGLCARWLHAVMLSLKLLHRKALTAILPCNFLPLQLPSTSQPCCTLRLHPTIPNPPHKLVNMGVSCPELPRCCLTAPPCPAFVIGWADMCYSSPPKWPQQMLVVVILHLVASLALNLAM